MSPATSTRPSGSVPTCSGRPWRPPTRVRAGTGGSSWWRWRILADRTEVRGAVTSNDKARARPYALPCGADPAMRVGKEADARIVAVEAGLARWHPEAVGHLTLAKFPTRFARTVALTLKRVADSFSCLREQPSVPHLF